MSRHLRSTDLRPERATWCLTTNGYADEATCVDPETSQPVVDHDHYDVAIDEASGDVMYRIDPIGTTYLLPDGDTVRLVRYEDEPFMEPPISDRIVPVYDYWSKDGGAAGGLSLGNVRGLFEGPNLAPGVIRTYAPTPERPAVGSVFVRPNGEVWRLVAYRPDWTADPFTGDLTEPEWRVQYPTGMTSSVNGEERPADSRLVWAP